MGARHEVSQPRAEDLPHFPPGERRLRRLSFTVGKSELGVTRGLQGGVQMPPAVLKFVPLTGCKDPDRAAGGAIDQSQRTHWSALLAGKVLSDFLQEVLWGRLNVSGHTCRNGQAERPADEELC